MDSELGERNLTVSESFNGREGYHIATRPKLYSEAFEKVAPYYISFGMTYGEFWDGDCDMARDYRKAHELKLREANQYAWLQGAYIYQAIGALAPALKAFAKGRPQEYVKEPFGAEGYEEKPVDKQKTSDNKAKQWLEMWAINFNEKFDKQGGGANG